MTTKYTLLSLCASYDKVEIPIIQRDYAQGREEQSELRKKFVKYLVASLESNTPVVLDFVYGNERKDPDQEGRGCIKTFIPVDGQQRLTTLWLLHWFLSVNEGRLMELKPILNRFTYETRPSAHDFCKYLLLEDCFPADIPNIDEYIKNRTWFDPEWENDGSVCGMLRMLHTFTTIPALYDGTIKLDQLLSPNDIISFYFVPLKEFGLSEELYIRMNARGKILTPFENFKSEFYKILKDNPRLDEIKDKIEYDWVANLWQYRKKDIYTTDECFMSFLWFVTRMLYFSQAEYRAEEGYEKDFVKFDLLREIYSNEKNVDFLIFALDNIPFIASLQDSTYIWSKNGNKTISNLLSMSAKGENMEIDQFVVLFSAFMYVYKHPDCRLSIVNNEYLKNLNDYIRVVRNLIVNTKDKSERDQPRIIRSIIQLCENENVYEHTRKAGFNLHGLRDSQCMEENVKSNLMHRYPIAKALIQEIEDNLNFSGNIMPILASVYTDKENEIQDFVFTEERLNSFDVTRLRKIYDSYKIISEDDFSLVWGDLLNTSLYFHKNAIQRLVYDDEYMKHPAIISISAKFMDSKVDSVLDYLQIEEKKFVKSTASKYENLGSVRDVKVQLYLLYIFTLRVMNRAASDFFANGYNFGWLRKETGFTSLFDSGINDDPEFSEANPIFQTYYFQFRYNWGLNKEHSLPCEIVGNGKPQKPWEKLIEWANS